MMAFILLTALFVILLSFTGFYVLYYLTFGFIYLIRKNEMTPFMGRRYRFLILIPAHNEERTLLGTIDSISNVSYPKDLVKIVVVADNSDDRTAEIARERGTACLVRKDPIHIGKGYALKWGIENISNSDYDVLVVIDADTRLHADYLIWMNQQFQKGTLVAQGFNHIANANESPLTCLMEITSYLRNLLFYAAKGNIGLSSALMGTGMAFRKEIIEKCGWTAFSVGEDWEQTCLLALEGVPIAFVEKAITYAEEASSFRQGYSQRLRWAGGKFQVAWRYGFRLLHRGLINRDKLQIDVGLMILAPNYSLLANLTLALLGVTFIMPESILVRYLKTVVIALLAIQALYFTMGLFLKGLTFRALTSVFLAPLFLIWKMYVDIVSILKVKGMRWVRTPRA
jgi:cellulose synthase/poly-beta-1,6-N-acetylglucosamine synthase-like glycosyltransferase